MRCYPRPIGPSTSGVHRSSERSRSRKLAFPKMPDAESVGFLGTSHQVSVGGIMLAANLERRRNLTFMSPSNLLRLGGLAAVGAGVLTIIGDLVGLGVYFKDMAVAATTFSFALSFWLYMLGSVLLLGGLVAVYVYHSEEAVLLGVVGFVVAFLGTALIVGAEWAQVFVAPLLAANAPQFFELGAPGGLLVTFITLGVGWLLFGIATLRAGVFPRWAVILLTVGAVLSFFPVPLSSIVLSAAVIWLGFILLTGRGLASGEQPHQRVR